MGYILEMQEAGAVEWKKSHEKTLRAAEHVVTGLSAGKKYSFRVAAVNVNGTGDFSDPCAETEPVERLGEFSEEVLTVKGKGKNLISIKAHRTNPIDPCHNWE